MVKCARRMGSVDVKARRMRALALERFAAAAGSKECAGGMMWSAESTTLSVRTTHTDCGSACAGQMVEGVGGVAHERSRDVERVKSVSTLLTENDFPACAVAARAASVEVFRLAFTTDVHTEHIRRRVQTSEAFCLSCPKRRALFADDGNDNGDNDNVADVVCALCRMVRS